MESLQAAKLESVISSFCGRTNTVNIGIFGCVSVLNISQMAAFG